VLTLCVPVLTRVEKRRMSCGVAHRCSGGEETQKLSHHARRRQFARQVQWEQASYRAHVRRALVHMGPFQNCKRQRGVAQRCEEHWQATAGVCFRRILGLHLYKLHRQAGRQAGRQADARGGRCREEDVVWEVRKR